jgi:[ribosomal protein S5]-alanine N-acetyltransferase
MSEDAIDTPRLRGERPEPADTGFYRALFGDARVAATLWPGELGGARAPGQADALLARDIAHWERHGFGPWVFAERESGRAVARAGLQWTMVDGREEVEILYAVAADAWGSGYAAETAEGALEAARRRPEIHQVVSVVWTENPASRRVTERTGLRPDHLIDLHGLPHLLFRAEV